MRSAPICVPIAIGVAGAAFFGACASGQHGPAGPGSAAPGVPRVQDNRIVDGAGAPLRLLGVNRSGSEYACLSGSSVFDGPVDDAALAAIVAWRTNVVRVPLNEDCWLGINGVPAATGGAAYQTAIADLVDRLHRHGQHAILDLHWAAPGTTRSSAQLPMADADHAPAFWASVAARFKGDPLVLFDLYNEPYLDEKNARTTDPWACWRDGCTVEAGGGVDQPWQSAGMAQLVAAIRGAGATQILLLGGLAYANDLSGWAAHVPRDPLNNLAASFHAYNFNACNGAGCWDQVIAPLAASYPVVTGELGENDCAHGFIDGYMGWADGHGVSYLGWAWDTYGCGAFPALITAYSGTPTPFGAGFKAHLAVVRP